MRHTQLVLIGLLISLSGWLWIQLRDTGATFNSFVIVERDSQLSDARNLELMLRDGRVDAALILLQKRRDTWVYALDDVLGTVNKSSWRWPHDEWLMDQGSDALSSEVIYRNEYPQLNTGLSEQVSAKLKNYE